MKVFNSNISKIFIGVFLCAFIFATQIVSAEKTDWSDNSYNFKSVKKIVVFNFDFPAAVAGQSDIMKRKLAEKYFEGVKKLKCEVLTEEQAKRILTAQKNINFNALSTRDARQLIRENLSGVADAWIDCKIKTWKNDYYIIPARTVWEDRRRTRKVRDRSGDWIEETYYETVPVTYPPRRVDTSDITTEFSVYDAKTSQMIFGREDVRSREDAEAQLGMLGRMSNSFFSDFAKKIK